MLDRIGDLNQTIHILPPSEMGGGQIRVSRVDRKSRLSGIVSERKLCWLQNFWVGFKVINLTVFGDIII